MEPYYEGDVITLEFNVKENLRPFTPHSAYVTIYRGREETISNQQTEVDGSKIRFRVDSKYTERKGDYKAVFTVYLTPTTPRTHIKWFRILPKGAVISKKEDAELSKGIDKDSSEDRVDTAIGMAIRALRKAESDLVKVSKRAEDIISKKTNKKRPIDHYSEEGY
jgi:hypothetical protein